MEKTKRKMHKVIVVFDAYNVPFLYEESYIINEEWLNKHEFTKFDIIETPLSAATWELLYLAEMFKVL